MKKSPPEERPRTESQVSKPLSDRLQGGEKRKGVFLLEGGIRKMLIFEGE
jgi:hypothetical protein